MNIFSRKSVLTCTAAAAASLLCGAADLTVNGETVIGLHQHYVFNEGNPAETISLMKQAGVNAFRCGYDWNRIELPGEPIRMNRTFMEGVKLARQNGIEPLVVLSFSHAKIGGRFPWRPEDARKFNEEYVRFVVGRLKGKARFYQIWNEWDFSTGVGRQKPWNADPRAENTPQNYVKFLQQTAPFVRQLDPDAVIIGNSFCLNDDGIIRAFEAGMLDHVDAYAFHTYDNTHEPEFVMRRVRRYAEASRKFNHGKVKPFFITEMSWPTGPDCVDLETQGDFLARFYLLLKAQEGFKGLWWYSTHDRGYNWTRIGLAYGAAMTDLTPKPAFFCLQSVAPLVKNGTFVRDVPTGMKKVHFQEYKMKDGSTALAVWTEKRETRVRFVLDKHGSACRGVIFVRCGSPAVQRHWGFLDQNIEKKDVGPRGFQDPEDPELFSFQASSRPVILYNVPKNFTIREKYEYPAPESRWDGRITWSGTEIDLPMGLCWQQLAKEEPYRGTGDLAVSLRFRRLNMEDPKTKTDNLMLDVTVSDDRHTSLDKVTWVLAAPHLDGSPFPRFIRRYSIYDDPKTGRPRLECIDFQTNKPFRSTARFSVKKSGDKRIYSFVIPYKDMQLSLKELNDKKIVLGSSVIVYDCDGKKVKGFARWSGNPTGWGHNAPLGPLYVR